MGICAKEDVVSIVTVNVPMYIKLFSSPHHPPILKVYSRLHAHPIHPTSSHRPRHIFLTGMICIVHKPPPVGIPP